MEKTELIFIPWPTMGHLAQIVELAKLMINNRETKLSITVLIMKLPDFIDSEGSALIDSLVDSSTIQGLQFFELPPANPDPEWSSRTRGYFVHKLIESQKSHVKSFIEQFRVRESLNSKLNGFVADMLCSTMIDVADNFGIPCYVFFASGAGFLGMMLHFQTLQDEHKKDIFELSNSNSSLRIPSFVNPIPPTVLPLVLVEKQQWLGRFLHYARGYRKAKGIVINTFLDLEKHALNSFSTSLTSAASYGEQKIPQIYSIGPVLNKVQCASKDGGSDTLKWLDEQPPRSVVYVCFGSQGSLKADQVKELANGLERSGYRFLWSLRRPSPKNITAEFPSEYVNHGEVLPEGFLDRTARIGKVVGWAPQLAVLSSASVGGFVSHCGWNSVLESIWCGVPISTWPLHSEQQLNAFQLVKELGLAEEITLDYQERHENQQLVTAEAIERGIRKVMQSDSEVRKNVQEMREKSRMSMTQGGSSYKSLGGLMDQILLN